MNEFLQLAFWLRTVSEGVEITDYELLVEIGIYLNQKWCAWYQDLLCNTERKYQMFDSWVFDEIMMNWDISRFYK